MTRYSEQQAGDGRKLAVFLIGAPGVGKSTAARRLADSLDCHVFQSGQVLREAAKNAEDPQLRRIIDSRMRERPPSPRQP